MQQQLRISHLSFSSLFLSAVQQRCFLFLKYNTEGFKNTSNNNNAVLPVTACNGDTNF